MHPYTYPLANALVVTRQLVAANKGASSMAETIADLFAPWPEQRRKELYDILEETISATMSFKDLVTAVDEALYINAIDWQHTLH